jgi:hypothetical protein
MLAVDLVLPRLEHQDAPAIITAGAPAPVRRSGHLPPAFFQPVFFVVESLSGESK